MTLVVQGLDELVAGLAAEGAGAEKKASKVVGEVAQHVKETAKATAPKRTGDLADSIGVTGRGGRREIGPTVRYGGFVEYGTYKDAPQPFMEPALSAHEGELDVALAAEVGNLA